MKCETFMTGLNPDRDIVECRSTPILCTKSEILITWAFRHYAEKLKAYRLWTTQPS